MKLFMFLSLIVTSGLFVDNSSLSGKGDRILGHWWTEEKDAKIQVYKEGDRFAGKIIWLKDSLNKYGKPVMDSQNPKKELRSRNILGINIISGFVYEGGRWEGGEIYDPNNGKTYSCIMKLRNGQLEVKGYVGVPMFGRTVTWTRVEED